MALGFITGIIIAILAIAAFDSYMCGSDLECTGDCENCPCHVFGETYNHMKEAEALE